MGTSEKPTEESSAAGRATLPEGAAALVFTEDGIEIRIPPRKEGERHAPGHVMAAAALGAALIEDDRFRDQVLGQAAQFMYGRLRPVPDGDDAAGPPAAATEDAR